MRAFLACSKRHTRKLQVLRMSLTVSPTYVRNCQRLQVIHAFSRASRMVIVTQDTHTLPTETNTSIALQAVLAALPVQPPFDFCCKVDNADKQLKCIARIHLETETNKTAQVAPDSMRLVELVRDA